tara:strand:+ start:232 stop:579 length:348 start_codon:yes stop_codon:yes gene_type:complete
MRIILNNLLGYKIMTNPNYTPDMIAILKAAQPIDLSKAQALAIQLDRGVRSIIAKCKREGFEYISKPAPAKKKAAPTKLQMVADIYEATGAENLEGLEKATGASLNNLLLAILHN